MILAILLACGVEGPLDQPLPPPAPPPVLVSAEPDVVRQSGVVSDVHGPTRSFVLTGEGKRVVVHLRDSGTLRLGGQPSQVQDLQEGTTVWVEGKRQGDLLVVVRAADTEEGADAPGSEAVASGAAAAGEGQGAAPGGPPRGAEASTTTVTTPASPGATPEASAPSEPPAAASPSAAPPPKGTTEGGG